MTIRVGYDELAAANVTFVVTFFGAKTIERYISVQVFKFYESSKCVPCVICYNYCGFVGQRVGRALNVHTDSHIMAIKHKNCVHYSRHYYYQASVLSMSISIINYLYYMSLYCRLWPI